MVPGAVDAFGAGGSVSLRAAERAQAAVGCVSRMDFSKFGV